MHLTKCGLHGVILSTRSFSDAPKVAATVGFFPPFLPRFAPGVVCAIGRFDRRDVKAALIRVVNRRLLFALPPPADGGLPPSPLLLLLKKLVL